MNVPSPYGQTYRKVRRELELDVNPRYEGAAKEWARNAGVPDGVEPTRQQLRPPGTEMVSDRALRFMGVPERWRWEWWAVERIEP
ncbi:hypothetical protein ACQP25_44645 (plasmid) [Microtetraspora malaysiensis]|uniref:hypothetical protein n=1 Tax=Microtetraspora malaysiensis TaxID=161358 RepID=UPI003D8A9934